VDVSTVRPPGEGSRDPVPPESVSRSQRERLLQATLEAVSERGFAATTLTDITRRARVSRNVFYEQFADKEACFLAACDAMAGELHGVVLAAARGHGGDWLAALRAGMAAYLEWWTAWAPWASAYFVELPAAGERARRQRDDAYERFRGIFVGLAAQARRERPELPPVLDVVPSLLVVSITEIVGGEIRAGRAGALPGLGDELVEVVVRLLSDDRDVARLT
jgi:AcrR family transcriptional regulator